jgi:hypothetical protein
MTEVEIDQLADRLRVLGNRVDPVPVAVTAAARAAFAWRTVDAELAELTYDSWVDDRALAGVRGCGGARQLTFEAPGLTVEMEVGAAAPCLVGQLVPAHPGTVEVRHDGGSLTLAVDDLGRFAAKHLPAGPLSLRCVIDAGAGAAPVETEWVAV